MTEEVIDKPSLPSRVALLIIRFYQLAISPHFNGCCRFEPCCSEYGIIAFRRFGFLKAFKLTLSRLLRCRPGGPYGYDPVPQEAPLVHKEECECGKKYVR